jgi:hypothetical protein
LGNGQATYTQIEKTGKCAVYMKEKSEGMASAVSGNRDE